MDWDKILQLSPKKLSEQQKDDLCKTITHINIDSIDINQYELKNLFNIYQEVLKHKNEQVLLSEFDEIAQKQGVEEARTIQHLENEIKSLKSSSESRHPTPDSENENLKTKIKTLKTNVKLQAQEIDKLKKDNLVLQEENNMLQLELQSGYQESDSQSENSEFYEKQKDFAETIRQKNKHISQLLTDIEVTEKENVLLKEQIVSLRNELNEATCHLTSMTSEVSIQTSILKETIEKVNSLSDEKLALRNQIEEIVKQKEDREAEIDEFASKLDYKVDEMKKLLDVKQSEIKILKQENLQLEKKISQYSDCEYKVQATVLKERERQIEDLRSKLQGATEEINKNTIIIKNISETKIQNTSQMKEKELVEGLKSQITKIHERTQELQELLTSAEQDAQQKGQQLTELMSQLKKYEEGEYGLVDAVKEMQELKVQINIRDKQITQLVRDLNKLQNTCDEIERENLALREKLGLPLDATISKSGIISKQRKQKKLITNLQNQIEILEDEKLQMKVDLQKYKRRMSESQLKGGRDVIDGQGDNKNIKSEMDYENKYEELIEENEALRKGMHEILDSVREKKGKSVREIKSKTLEELLHILDARHVTGWYHPAMKLQAEINTLQGTIEELRNQLKLSRSQLNMKSDQLQITEVKLQELQKKVGDSTEKLSSIDGNLTSIVLPPNLSSTSAEIISKLNSHLLVVLNEYHSEMENSNKLTQKIETYKREINVIRQQIGLLYKQHIEEKKILTEKYEEIKSENCNLSQSLNELQTKLENYSSGSADLGRDLISLNRKCLYLEENEKRISAENSKMKLEICQIRNATTEHINNSEIAKDALRNKINNLEEKLRESVSVNEMEVANKKIYDLTSKYRELVENLNNFKENNNVLLMKKEIELLNTEKDKLYFELLQFKSKSYLNDHANDEIVQITKKLANFELNELSERQRADHINNLYELVKEQLKKCEERCVEYENQNKLLINSNLKLQITQQELQDNLTNFVNKEEHKNIEDKLFTTQEELQNIKNKHQKLQTKYVAIETELKTKEMLKLNQSIEIVNLKHLLLDLQSNSDEKALIARLSTEVVLARICESDAKNRLDVLRNEIQQLKEDQKHKNIELNNNFVEMNNLKNQFNLKYRLMERIINSVRTQYLGSTPLSTQERIINILQQIYFDKQAAFKDLQNIQKQKNDIIFLQDHLNIEMENTMELKSMFLKAKTGGPFEKIMELHREKNTFQLNEFKYKRNLEIKETELQQALNRLKKQDTQLLSLEEELLNTKNNILSNLFISDSSSQISRKSSIESGQINDLVDAGTDPHVPESTKTQKSIGIQTNQQSEMKKYDEKIATLQNEIKHMNELISLKDSNLKRQESLISDLEKTNETFKSQLKDKQDVGTSTKEVRNQVNVIDEVDLEEYNELKNTVSKLQLLVNQKEETITKYETLLKEGKDEHCLAALRFQDEIKKLQVSLQQQKQVSDDLKKKPEPCSTVLSNKAVIEQYVSQVHDLEGHMAEMQTSVSSLNSQLQASRQESVRWRTLANDRLKSIENLRKESDNQHEEEISLYKEESEKYKEEIITLKKELSKFRVKLSQKSTDVIQEIQEKDKKVHELSMEVMQLKNELKLLKDDEKNKSSPEFSELELSKQLLEAEYEALKKRYENLLKREKKTKDEIRKLKGQLIKRPVFSVRSDRSEKTVKDQLQKKIAHLEKELAEANEKLEREAQFNETRRLKIAEDFTQWEKQKRWQQAAEKCKEKLAAKEEDLEKLQQSYNSAKAIISRLEREKHILEGKLKHAKNPNFVLNSSRIESVEQENLQLKSQIESLSAKLEMQQYHSGGLGAALLQEKLEAQERKIAVLELSGKGTCEVTAELERLNSTVASLQKANLRLEAENLELSLDLKKATADGPYLREQIQHLERYIDVLKSEQSEHHVVTNAGDQLQSGNKKVLELERTVLSLKRLVEKLQVENKRLQSRPCSSTSDRKVPSETQAELKKVRQQYSESVQRSSKLEDELAKTQKHVRFLESIAVTNRAETESSLSTELTEVKAQLAYKAQLLDKVKILLQKAAIKERFLVDQVEQLKARVTPEVEEQKVENGNQ